MIKPSNKWRNKILPLYKAAVNHFDYFSQILKWDTEAITAYYAFESYGLRNNISSDNGCARDKFLMDLHVQLWKDGIKESLFTKEELICDLSETLKQYFNKAL